MPLDRILTAGRTAIDRAKPYVEARTLIVLLLISALGWGFAELADEMLEGDTHEFDRAVLLALRNPADPADPLGPGWLEEFGRDVTALGGTGVLAALTLAVAGYLWIDGKRRMMVLLLIAIVGGQVVSSLTKLGFDRPRPDLVPHGAQVYTASFPSGHAMMATVTYLTLATLLAQVEPRRALRVYLLALAIILSVSVGVSRVYLGVHWPTDVLAGWTAGAAWALLCLSTARWLGRRGMVEPAQDLPPPAA